MPVWRCQKVVLVQNPRLDADGHVLEVVQEGASLSDGGYVKIKRRLQNCTRQATTSQWCSTFCTASRQAKRNVNIVSDLKKIGNSTHLVGQQSTSSKPKEADQPCRLGNVNCYGLGQTKSRKMTEKWLTQAPQHLILLHYPQDFVRVHSIRNHASSTKRTIVNCFIRSKLQMAVKL